MNIGGSNRFHPSTGTQGQRFDPFNHQKMADYWSGLGAPFETFTLGDWTFLEVERRTPWHQAGWSQVHVSISCCYPSPRASGIRRTHRSTNSLHLGIWRCIPWAFHVFSCSSLPLAFTLQTQVWLGSGTSQWIQHDSTIFSELLVSGPIPVILSTLAWMIHLPRTHGFELRGATWTDTGKFVFCAHFLVGWGWIWLIYFESFAILFAIISNDFEL